MVAAFVPLLVFTGRLFFFSKVEELRPLHRRLAVAVQCTGNALLFYLRQKKNNSGLTGNGTQAIRCMSQAFCEYITIMTILKIWNGNVDNTGLGV